MNHHLRAFAETMVKQRFNVYACLAATPHRRQQGIGVGQGLQGVNVTTSIGRPAERRCDKIKADIGYILCSQRVLELA